jgi:hypothetical protein
MEAMRQTWTDDRMDDLAERMETGFAQAHVDLAATREDLRGEIKGQGQELRGEIKAQGEELREEMAALRSDVTVRLESLNAVVAAGQRTMLQICSGLCVALIATMATLISTAAG